jgi:hypothetical protein
VIAQPPHERKLGLVGVALTQQRNNRHTILALTTVRDEVEILLTDNGFFEGNPFSWVTLAIRFGLKNDEFPTYAQINRKYGDLPLSIEIDCNGIDQKSLGELVAIFRQATFRALIHVGNKLGRPIDYLKYLDEGSSKS